MWFWLWCPLRHAVIFGGRGWPGLRWAEQGGSCGVTPLQCSRLAAQLQETPRRALPSTSRLGGTHVSCGHPVMDLEVFIFSLVRLNFAPSCVLAVLG